ncbi:hypothetical protein F5887DRAFT_612476 [Amanita rubescens]|nr:hypothetical protein F5887DRAFT_612476 [Amanita rubescens]
MTSSVEITLWGGLPAVKKEVVDTFLAADAPAETFFNALSACRSTTHLLSVIREHYLGSRHPNSTQSSYAVHYHNPTEYHITEVVVLKRRFVVQHEGFVFRVHHQPPAGHGPAEADFLICVDTPPRSIFAFHKVAIDHINCSLVHPMALQGTFRRPMVWRMGQVTGNYVFNLNLLQVGVLLQAIITPNPNPPYHALQVNCFSHSRVIRTVLRYIIQAQQIPDSEIIVTAHEPHVRGVTLGKCFGFRLDREDPGESAAIFATYSGQYTWLTA